MADFPKLDRQRSEPDARHAIALYGGTDLEEAALAIERVLASAHERGCSEAVRVQSVVANLLREVARR